MDIIADAVVDAGGEREQVEQVQRDFHFIVTDFISLCDAWGPETVVEYMARDFPEFYQRFRKEVR